VWRQTVNDLRFTDDIDVVAEVDGQLEVLTDKVHSSSQKGSSSKSMWRPLRQ